MVFASSNHAVGFTPRESFPVPDGAAPAPDTYYGVSKAAGEALAALYARRYGIEAVCVRVLSCFDRPRTARMLATWLSPDDAGRLFEACVTAPAPGFRVIYGVSANTRGGWVSLDGARALGYEPRDDAERYAAEVLAGARDGPRVAGPGRPGVPLPGRRLHLALPRCPDPAGRPRLTRSGRRPDARQQPASAAGPLMASAPARRTAARAGGFQIIETPVGTSGPTPLWGGVIALADQYAHHDLGLVNPAIYRIGRSPGYHKAFHDVTAGDNYVTAGSAATVTGYQAGPGWDPVTGWGSPGAQVLVPLLARFASSSEA